MNFLVDTCVISETIKPNPDQNVMNWYSKHVTSRMFLSVLVLSEISRGAHKVQSVKKRIELMAWLETLEHRYFDRIIPIDLEIAYRWSVLTAESEARGMIIPVVDGLICATSIVTKIPLVTRNTKHVELSGATIINPWED